MDVEDVHRLFDEVEFEIRKLGRGKRKEIDVLDDASDLCLIIGDVAGSFSAYSDMPARLGIAAPLTQRSFRD
jgi:hypothetical protein